MDDATRRRLEAFLDELDRWNRRINLTAVPRERAWGKHVEETLVLLDACRPPQGARIVDIGSGGGVPGMPLAILRPDATVVLVESEGRKCTFLQHAAAVLDLANVEVVNARAEEGARRPATRDGFDVAVSRALAPPPVMCELLLPFLRPGGVLATLVGNAAQAAADCARASELLGGAPPRTAPGNVLLIDKLAPTPERYPRRTGVPLRRPLV